ncbi:rhomboid family intramembrane serine protease [Hyphomonas sp. WL0036]|uniref:rhomboid family intramembrane serine protease n=1 Tax=Hyphomonas sediminis TaxID=2866160 RepID=UPI001C7ED9E9|nr:rhomboid family intramembrane serine protease [Hyphomonas sediminis]MBY9068497.1 rhomboid family intramembrane serine protease [Hyphomonas sediminis]
MSGQQTREPIINAPLPLTAFALTLIALHGLRAFLPEQMNLAALYHGALFPERFWGWVNGQVLMPSGAPAYPGWLEAAAPLFLSALLHGDWMHVILNAVFLLALGKPMIEILSAIYGGRNAGVWVILFVLIFLTQAAGGLFYLLLNNPSGPLAIGASGGISGLMGAFLLMRDGASARLLSRNFLAVTGLFIVANYLFALIGPSLLGASIAWEIHVGSFIAGAFLGRAFIWDALRRLDN